MKHRTHFGDIDTLTYAYEIGRIKSQKIREAYLSDVDDKFHDMLYLLAMQMGISKTIANLPNRGERKKAWQELPEHTKTLKSMKQMVYNRVVTMHKERLKDELVWKYQ